MARVFGAACISLFSICLVNSSNGQAGFGDENNPHVELVELFRVGGENSPDNLILDRIQGIAVNSAGELFIADRGEQAVFVISETGRLADRFGGKGEGPGEFARINSLYIGPEDSIYVYDVRRDRLTVFEPEERKFAYSLNIEGVEDGRYDPITLLGVAANAYIYRYGEGISFDSERNWNVDKRMLKIYQVGRDGNAAQAMLSMPDSDVVVFFTEERGPGVTSLPFGRTARIRFGPNGRVYAGRNDSLNISITNASGELEGSIRLQLPLESEPFAQFTSALDLGVGASSSQCDSARINLFDLCIAEVLLEWG